MNKMLLTISILFIASIGLVWYSAQSSKKKADQELIVAFNAEYPPFVFIENNKISGFDIDLITEIGKRLKQKLIFKNISFASLFPEAQTGGVDIVVSGITPTTQRLKDILFTKPYLKGDSLAIISLLDNPFTTIPHLLGKRVVVNEGFSSDFYLSKHKDIDIIRVDSIDQAFLELLSGRADAFISALKPLDSFLKLHEKNKLSVAKIPDTEEVYAIGITKQKSKLFKEIQTILNTLNNDGTLDLLKHKWGLTSIAD